MCIFPPTGFGGSGTWPCSLYHTHGNNPQHHKTLRHFFTAFALAIAISGVAQSTPAWSRTDVKDEFGDIVPGKSVVTANFEGTYSSTAVVDKCLGVEIIIDEISMYSLFYQRCTRPKTTQKDGFIMIKVKTADGQVHSMEQFLYKDMMHDHDGQLLQLILSQTSPMKVVIELGNSVNSVYSYGIDPSGLKQAMGAQGDARRVRPVHSYGSERDIDGNTYATIQIGTQVWMAENLRTTRYRNGDPIPNVTDGTQWGNLNTGAWAHYDNDSQHEKPYGKLYNWYAVADPRNVCPTGWHVPTDAEWTVLEDHLGDERFGSLIAGGRMKSTGTQYWEAPNSGATNLSGFSGLPGGARDGSDGRFLHLGNVGLWWSASESGAEGAWNRYLRYLNADVYRDAFNKRDGFCLRCVRD